jgi:hypothetical protein
MLTTASVTSALSMCMARSRIRGALGELQAQGMVRRGDFVSGRAVPMTSGTAVLLLLASAFNGEGRPRDWLRQATLARDWRQRGIAPGHKWGVGCDPRDLRDFRLAATMQAEILTGDRGVADFAD